MSATISLATGMTLQWGIAATSSLGKITSIKRKPKAELKKIAAGTGSTVAVVIYDKSEEYTLEIIAADPSTCPEIGATLSTTGTPAITATCTDADEAWSLNEVKKYNVTLTKWADITPAA